MTNIDLGLDFPITAKQKDIREKAEKLISDALYGIRYDPVNGSHYAEKLLQAVLLITPNSYEDILKDLSK